MQTDPGGQGASVSRSELSLEEQALRNDWPIPPSVRRKILQRLIDYLDRECDEGATAPDRTILAAARVLARFAGLSLQQARLDIARELADLKLGKGDSIDLEAVVREMAVRRDDLKQEQVGGSAE